MEATIEELVENLIKERALDGKEASEITDALEVASKNIEPSRLSGFVKSIREKIDAPTSEVFTQNGLNLNELKSVAEVVATVVIKEQIKESDRAEKSKKENESESEYNPDNMDKKEDVKEKTPEQEFEESMVRENLSFLEKSMPGLPNTTKERLAQGIFDAEKFAATLLKYKNTGLSQEEAEKKACEELGLGNSAADKAIRDRNIILAMEKRVKETQSEASQPKKQQEINENKDAIMSNLTNLTPIDLFKCLSTISQGLTTLVQGIPTLDSIILLKNATNTDAIKILRDEIAKLEEEIKTGSSEETSNFILLDKYKRLERMKAELRDSIRIDRIRIKQEGRSAELPRYRPYLKSIVDRFLQENNRETLIGIFESTVEEAKKAGINLEELIGFDDALNAVEEEMQKYPEQVGNAGTVKSREQRNYRMHMELKVLETTGKNAERKRKEHTESGKKEVAKRFDKLTEKRSMKKRKLLNKLNKNVDGNVGIKNQMLFKRKKEKSDRESFESLQNFDVEKIRGAQSAAEFMAYATEMYFYSTKTVSEIYEEFKEDCNRYGISAENLINAVVEETRKRDDHGNFYTIRDYETQIRKLDLQKAKLEEEDRVNGPSEKNSKRIEKIQEAIESRRKVNSSVKRSVVFETIRNREHNQEESTVQGKIPDVRTDLKRSHQPEPKKKKGIMAFLKRFGRKFEITDNDVKEGFTELADLQKAEEQIEQPPKGTLTVSTINVGTEPPKETNKNESAR